MITESQITALVTRVLTENRHVEPTARDILALFEADQAALVAERDSLEDVLRDLIDPPVTAPFSAWVRADLDFDEAGQAAMAALRRALRVGQGVTWNHGTRWLSGEVVRIDAFQYQSAKVLVRAASGKEYHVYASRILAGMKETPNA